MAPVTPQTMWSSSGPKDDERARVGERRGGYRSGFPLVVNDCFLLGKMCKKKNFSNMKNLLVKMSDWATLAKIACVLPMSNVSAERGFCLQSLIKTAL